MDRYQLPIPWYQHHVRWTLHIYPCWTSEVLRVRIFDHVYGRVEHFCKGFKSMKAQLPNKTT